MIEYVTDFVQSCHECLCRKITKVINKNAAVSHPTPKEPFSVWDVDLYGPLPCSPRGHRYLFTTNDMFSRFLYTKPLANKNALSVSEALFDLMCQFGACNTLISDQLGTEFLARVTIELCRMLNFPQQFTPKFFSPLPWCL